MSQYKLVIVNVWTRPNGRPTGELMGHYPVEWSDAKCLQHIVTDHYYMAGRKVTFVVARLQHFVDAGNYSITIVDE